MSKLSPLVLKQFTRAVTDSQASFKEGTHPLIVEAGASAFLAAAAQNAILETLEGQRRAKGRCGWWSDGYMSIADLYERRDKALQDGDHSSVLNYTAMLMAREAAAGEAC